MVRISLVCVFSFLLLFSSTAGDLKKVMRLYEKQDWQKTEEAIRKALTHQPINPGIRYYYSILYSHGSFARTNMDSARIQIRLALADYEIASIDILEEMQNEQLDTARFYEQLALITSDFYEESREQMTIEGWDKFIELFTDAPLLPIAIDARDSLALEVAKSDGSISAWKQFLDKYPNSKYIPLVTTKRDSLMVSGYITNHDEDKLRAYVTGQPTGKITAMALRHLLKLMTKSGEVEDFLDFLKEFKNSEVAYVVADWLFHIDKEQDFALFERYRSVRLDSLTTDREDAGAFYFPVFDEGYELVSATKENRKLVLSALSPDILCNGWSTDIIDGELDGEPVILSRSGKKIASGKLVRELGNGLILVSHDLVKSIYHKTGRLVIMDIDEAELIHGKVLKVKRSGWGLVSLMGLHLTDFRFDDIFVDGNFWFFQKDDLLATTTFHQVIDAFPKDLFLEFKFEDYELISADELIGFREDRECLLKSDGSFKVPWGRHHIYPADTLGYVRDERGYALYGQMQYSYFPYLEANKGFVLRKQQNWSLTSNLAGWTMVTEDSLRLLNPYFVLSNGTHKKILLHNKLEVSVKPGQSPLIFSPKSRYILLKDKVSQVIDDQGKTIFSGNFDEIRQVGDTLFSVSFRGKHGLIGASGKEMLPLKFEHLSNNDGMISVLVNGKIGGLDLLRKVKFEATLESKPERVGKYYKTTKMGRFGLIDSLQREVVPFNYDGLELWTENKAWLQSGSKFSLFDIADQSTLMDVTLLSPLQGDPDLYKFYGKSGFGIISRESGTIVPPEFTEVRLMGTSKRGVLMAEQALPQAGFMVVTYYTLLGDKIYSHAYRRGDYEKVFCDD